MPFNEIDLLKVVDDKEFRVLFPRLETIFTNYDKNKNSGCSGCSKKKKQAAINTMLRTINAVPEEELKAKNFKKKIVNEEINALAGIPKGKMKEIFSITPKQIGFILPDLDFFNWLEERFLEEAKELKNIINSEGYGSFSIPKVVGNLHNKLINNDELLLELRSMYIEKKWSQLFSMIQYSKRIKFIEREDKENLQEYENKVNKFLYMVGNPVIISLENEIGILY